MARVAKESESLAIDVALLKAERDRLKDGLRELESEQRKLEASLKVLRQREIQAKREIEALGVLIEVSDGRDKAASEAG